jgi:hypothetical protein
MSRDPKASYQISQSRDVTLQRIERFLLAIHPFDEIEDGMEQPCADLIFFLGQSMCLLQ